MGEIDYWFSVGVYRVIDINNCGFDLHWPISLTFSSTLEVVSSAVPTLSYSLNFSVYEVTHQCRSKEFALSRTTKKGDAIEATADANEETYFDSIIKVQSCYIVNISSHTRHQ
ncbi:hypothetical protein L1987_47046 [Smallanthus sonchifolius]|uniref:Uncharacterized protein n=1 Tax=Smallanthus sonchifolius TaxID=185202 RepID=A0ACB9G1B8_9ASTR|nr:hypothetical protein L1987_47046 [Smallanthus sonchifolius]